MEGPLGLQFFVISKVLLWTSLYMVLLSWDYRSRIQECVFVNFTVNCQIVKLCSISHSHQLCMSLGSPGHCQKIRIRNFSHCCFHFAFLRLLSEVGHGHLSVTCLCLSLAHFLLDCWLFLTGLWASFYILNTNDL